MQAGSLSHLTQLLIQSFLLELQLLGEAGLQPQLLLQGTHHPVLPLQLVHLWEEWIGTWRRVVERRGHGGDGGDVGDGLMRSGQLSNELSNGRGQGRELPARRPVRLANHTPRPHAPGCCSILRSAVRALGDSV
ncbi:hypothetical protein EYF80_012006 [Liparis tanakae]|uniref:Uncharacterized protein n=1 Tax=Liparis tanakae TaxID=230148 RepID=A0A4Z2IIQ4_9TELE|nr:hypothetical protein EYF80_012006 [Liparis tanakae]